MILAHHAGEHIVLMLAASGAGAVSVLAGVTRTRITQFVDGIRTIVSALWQRV